MNFKTRRIFKYIGPILRTLIRPYGDFNELSAAIKQVIVLRTLYSLFVNLTNIRENYNGEHNHDILIRKQYTDNHPCSFE